MKTGLHPTTPLSRSKERFLILICLILGLIVLVPILKRFAALRIFLDIFITAIYISMVYTVSHKKGHIYIGALLAIAMLISLWLQYFLQNDMVFAIGRVSGILLFIMVITNLLAFIFKSEDVAIEVIYAAMLVYLLMALMWSFAYGLLELINSASFNVTLSPDQGYQMRFIYYSFVTITTLGYGDITPATDLASSFSILEAVVGQLYLVVVVAWLVGMHASSKSR
jgi:voltage-gated potassium channel